MQDRSVDDYLKTIFLLGNKDVKSTDVARNLKVTRPTVSAMVKKLVDLKLVTSEHYGTINLTEKGKAHALKITHSYRVICDFLTEILGLRKAKAFEQAHKLEHVFLPDTIRRLEVYVQTCRACPHTEEIKNKDLMSDDETTLVQLGIGESAEVVRVLGKGSFRNRMLEMGLIRGAKITVDKFAPLGDPIEIKLMGYHLTLRKNEAKQVIVRK